MKVVSIIPVVLAVVSPLHREQPPVREQCSLSPATCGPRLELAALMEPFAVILVHLVQDLGKLTALEPEFPFGYSMY